MGRTTFALNVGLVMVAVLASAVLWLSATGHTLGLAPLLPFLENSRDVTLAQSAPTENQPKTSAREQGSSGAAVAIPVISTLPADTGRTVRVALDGVGVRPSRPKPNG